MKHFALLFCMLLLAVTGGTQGRAHNPHVNVSITPGKTTFAKGVAIPVTITLTNNKKKTQWLPFDQPRLSTGGPWLTSIEIKNLRSGKSVVRYPNKAVLSSTIVNQQALQSNYQVLAPGKSISRTYDLSDMVVLNNEDNKLPPGKYKMQLFYAANASNEVIFYIK